MKNWRTNLGGALSVTGTTLIGAGVLGNLSNSQYSAILWYVALLGFVLSAAGKGLTALFAADAKTVNNVAAAVDKINALGSDPGAEVLSVTPKPLEPPAETRTAADPPKNP
jgi:hypothetical protein